MLNHFIEALRAARVGNDGRMIMCRPAALGGQHVEMFHTFSPSFRDIAYGSPSYAQYMLPHALNADGHLYMINPVESEHRCSASSGA